jgi:hypothetical protein
MLARPWILKARRRRRRTLVKSHKRRERISSIPSLGVNWDKVRPLPEEKLPLKSVKDQGRSQLPEIEP